MPHVLLLTADRCRTRIWTAQLLAAALAERGIGTSVVTWSEPAVTGRPTPIWR